MIERRIVFSPEARDDLMGIFLWIADAAGREIALGYLDRIEAFCLRLGFGSERGQDRSDIRPNLRIIGFEKRLTIAFSLGQDCVTILRVFGAGRDWERLV